MKLPSMQQIEARPLARNCPPFSEYLLAIVIGGGLVATKFLAVAVPVLVIYIIASSKYRTTIALNTRPKLLASYALAALAFLTVLSPIWSVQPFNIFSNLMYLTFLSIATVFAAEAVSLETRENITRMGHAMYMALIAGLVYSAIRCATQGGVDFALVPQFARNWIKIGNGEITRSIIPVTLLLGPALLTVLSLDKLRNAKLVAGCLLLLSAIVVWISPHDTSKLGFLAFLAILGIGSLSKIASHRLLVSGLSALLLLVCPISVALRKAEIEKSNWLPLTAQQRIFIWDEYARRVMEKPIFGHGFGMSYLLRPEIAGVPGRVRRTKADPDPKPINFLATHPHNAYLQIWFELGAAGAALAAAIGLGILNTIRNLDDHQAPAIQATFASVCVLLLSSYGVWQYFMLAALALTAIASAIAVRVSVRQPSHG